MKSVRERIQAIVGNTLLTDQILAQLTLGEDELGEFIRQNCSKYLIEEAYAYSIASALSHKIPNFDEDVSYNGKPSYKLLERRLNIAEGKLKQIYETLGDELPLHAQIVKLKVKIMELKKIPKNGWTEKELEKILPKKTFDHQKEDGSWCKQAAEQVRNETIDECKQALLSGKKGEGK